MKRKILIILLIVTWGIIIKIPQVRAITITEHTVELNVKPGEVLERKMLLYDDSLQGAKLYVFVTNFKDDPNKEGSALLINNPEELKPDIAWIKLERDEIELPKSGEPVPFGYKIELPENADPGTHLLAIVFQTKPPKVTAEGNIISITASVVDNIFLRIAGATVDSLEAEFKTGKYINNNPAIPITERQKSFKEKYFFTRPPVDFLVRVINKGNTHQKPGGNIRIQNDLFGEAYEKIPINIENYIVLPNASRGFEVDGFGQGFMFGKYRAKLTLIYGDPLKDYTKEVVFWIFPLKEISLALGITLLIVIIIIFTVIILKKRGKVKEKEKEEKLRKTLREEIEKKLKEPKEKVNKEKSNQSQG